jgi:D-alanine-D-alanine ligase
VSGGGRPLLALVFEAPEACRTRLLAQGFSPGHAAEIAAYLDQSTDIAPEFDAIAQACEARGFGFRPVDLGEAPTLFAAFDPARTLVWTLTDGIQFFRGSTAPALARLHGISTFGSDDSLFALCQDKFRSGAVLRALGLPVPPAGLSRDGEWLVPPPPAPDGFFVKPNRLGAKIGIWEDSRCRGQAEALSLSRRIFAAYRDETVVQAYVPGRNIRASFLAVEPQAGAERLGLSIVDSGGDFQTMTDSLALSGAKGTEAAAMGLRQDPRLEPVVATQPEADRRIRTHAAKLMGALGLRDVFSLDWRVEGDGTVHLLEFEVCPGLPYFDFMTYVREEWGLGLAQAMAEAAARKFEGQAASA